MKLINASSLFEGSFPIFHHLFGCFFIIGNGLLLKRKEGIKPAKFPLHDSKSARKSDEILEKKKFKQLLINLVNRRDSEVAASPLFLTFE